MSAAAIDFTLDVLAASRLRPVLVDFWADWCGPCKMLGPVLERLAAEPGARWSLVKIDVEAHPELAQRFGIRGIPDVRLYAGGEEIARFTGALPEPQLRTWLAEKLPAPKREIMANARQLLRSGQAHAALDLLRPLAAAHTVDHELATLTARAEVFSDPAAALIRIAPLPPGSAWTDDAGIITALADAFATLSAPAPALADQPWRDTYLTALRDLRAERFDAAARGLIDVLLANPAADGNRARAACLALFRHLGLRHPVSEAHSRRYNLAVNA